MDFIQKKVNTEMLELLPADITPPQIMMLYQLYKLGLCKLSQLADRLQVKPSSITVMIDRLEKAGFVERLADPNDRRIVLVQLTDKGLDIIHQTVELREKVMTPLFSDLPEDQLIALVETFEKITKKYEDEL
ncbi:MarR family winged helix-turn-helix transcriptional regulator [Paenibacillus selenitireducens]|nr:MarR family transcriptional regulator [Paenibacillus selenitireducens]